ncbi:heme-binding protein : Heme-binding protein OS=Planctomyces brasiliensis (strain ATCC 49424 / DSM 5305 / JCM 21570 / NBRC 103401 / IFAM 1448) GN=Plabr_4796 PE=4 SV=1: CotH: GSDH: Cytochrom_C [Gemmata massiliana]|uniref:Cytochrome c domain-containing protein n=1 Tax=Gemmata massiliana TaxID=1210884 RepID=A0A6P2D7M2_9BACT|nr:PVC-type heme-binding CxxCH protein [Gemmata massiliana]VTR95502.1 heme-binding protein : Heme-binding protein OS=Planctomyces brasiliensis (strain ATCC 49424 / DSM 5305 / JCM 21570 / NBRC 103401 / IFAM 1448) GN=Plabr_4796 PE=4 SV=1: CotH: GSDH: Cytochrom_C [Gemmata massiliana]
MFRRLLTRAAALCCGLLLLAALLSGAHPLRHAAAEDPKPQAENTFGLTKVWAVRLDISAKEFDALQPALGGFGFPGGPPPKKEEKKDDKKRDTEKNLFGTDFPWAEGDVVVGSKSLKKVGVRYSGDMSYFVSARGLKRPLKIAFDKFSTQQLDGRSAVQLNAMPLDPTKARAALAYSVFRAVGVPAPQTAFAEVTLTVPGKYDKEFVGLYTVVENVDAQFLAAHFGSDKGLLMKPFRVRGIDALGDDWERYKGQYQPHRDATKAEAQRVIDFAKLVNQSTDDEFKKQIGSYLDVDAFLRFQAANAFVSNMDSFFAVGWNYTLYLDPKTNKFAFIPGDLEGTFASPSFLGTPDQLMDLSVTKPYPGENKLPDRLLAIKEINEKYQKLLKELSATAFTKDQLLKDADAIDKATKTAREKETKAVAARKEPAPGFGPPGAMGPQAPDMKTFAEKRTASVTAQVAGKSKGFVPQFNFGPPAGGGGFGGGNSQPIGEKSFRETVQVPPEFEATLFAIPPKVNYPVAIAAEPTGAIYVAVDEQGSLGRTPGGGKILRCVDKDGDGKVDDVTVFAKVEHPRGVCYRNGSVWVMHPPTLSVFHDDNGDGVSDRQEVLVTGLTTEQVTTRGGDHTTNCVRMGIDGWLYIGVGDYGIKEAKGKDGKTIVQRGGGIVRVRLDGTDLEVYCTGLRNPFDLAIDPFMNLFTRDNTNDGAGWDTRVSLLRQSALYGYTQLFANFTDEIMPTLGTFGGGGGTGGVFVQDSRWPAQYRNALFTGDWGRSEVYFHDLKANGPTFDLKQELFMKMPRATGMDVDGSGRLFVASWRNGSAVGFEGPNIGFVARVTPKGFKAEPFPDLKSAGPAQIVKLLTAPNAVTRLHAQGEILHRGKHADTTKALVALAADATAAPEGRVAAIYTLKQLDGKDSHAALLKLAEDAVVRESALRALTDRKGECTGLEAKVFVAALSDESPRVRAQALISLGRLNDPTAVKSIIPLTARPKGSAMPTTKPLQNQPDPDRVVPHLAVRALVALNATDACLEALDGPHWEGALWALRYAHDPKSVEGLIKKLGSVRTPELRRGILVTLIRLYHREADYKGSWWGIRPDNTGPYYDRVEWDMSKRIGGVITAAALDGDKETVAFLKSELARHKVALAGIPGGTEIAKGEKENPIVLPKADPKNPNQIGNTTYENAAKLVLTAKGDAKKGEVLFKSQSCVACHTTADGQTPKGPHLVDIGKRYKPDELVESILKPSAKLAQGYETYRFVTTDDRVFQGFVVGERADATIIRESTGVQRELKRSEIASRQQQKQSAMPEGLAANLTPPELADLIAYLQSLK